MSLKIQEEGLFEADLQRNLNLFLGAGFSVLAGSAVTKSMPVGDELRQLLIEHFSLQSYSSLDLPGIYAVINADRRDALRNYLQKVFKVTNYDKRYDELRKLDVEFIYTTNIDDLPFSIFDARSSDSGKVLHDYYTYGAPRSASGLIQFIPLHGNVVHEDGQFLFTAGQMSAAFASDRETWYVFQRELQSRPTLFLGYGMRDAGVLQALNDSSDKVQFNRWILLRHEDVGAEALYKSLGFHVIIGETQDFLAHLSARKSYKKLNAATESADFVGAVPLAAQSAKRPIRSFFLGAEPEWSDAYSNQVVRRRINSDIKNSIYNKKHIAVVGLPLSGKSTILKQLAAEFSNDRISLYFDKISGPMTEKIISEHAGKDNNPLIFIDNMLDSRDAINKIHSSTDAQIVSAEQGIYFDAVNLKISADLIDVHSCSEISPQDLQKIIDSIPVDIRRFRLDKIDLIERDAENAGLFESFRRHVYEENLTARFRQKLAEFELRDREAFDVYIMACYVAGCRTVVSFDMMYMFLNHPNKQYGDVYSIAERIESFLVDVDMQDDPHQDYFSVRSSALARIALRECHPRSFERVFDRFHSAVPERVIVEYNTFRRYAYDNDFAIKAYPSSQDGVRFYERLVRVTDNAYDFQHCAIYLSRMKNFQEAFSWIDNALSRSKVFPIRNTHARILFEANFDILKMEKSNFVALSGIEQSMDVLEFCIENDTKRSYHLLRFSDQAVHYSKIRGDERAVKWLTSAKERLQVKIGEAKIQGNRESYNLSRYKTLYNQVTAELTPLKK